MDDGFWVLAIVVIPKSEEEDDYSEICRPRAQEERTSCGRAKQNILSLQLLLESGLRPAIIVMGIHPNMYPITITGNIK
jgi:hypothetical protein